MITYYLYLDESGDFNDEKKAASSSPSLVGGFLCSDLPSMDRITEKMPSAVHASEDYDKSFLALLKDVKNSGGQFVIFENNERISVINGDVTYLNILSEGLVKTLLSLRTKHLDDDIRLIILIANRIQMGTDSSKKSLENLEIIPQEDYVMRLEEKLIIAIGRQSLTGVDYSITFASARRSRLLMIADVVCNTYISRQAKKKFTDEERDMIRELYSDSLIFPVFDNATVGYLQRLLIDKRYSEMICQMCALPKLTGVAVLRNRLITRLAGMHTRQRDSVFSAVSQQISQYNYARSFSSGIAFAENYKNYILKPLADKAQETGKVYAASVLSSVDYWTFDTDFYILTMYDHLGNTSMCDRYLEKCRANIKAVDRSWEHIDYYFKFRIRELNTLIGRFEFDEVIEKADRLIAILTDAKELFEAIGAYDDTGIVPTSELLGKVQGVKLEALINIIRERPEKLEKAISVSDAAIHEFDEADDLRRQWQLRSQLMVEAGKPDEALDCLMRSVNIAPSDTDRYQAFINIACVSANSLDVFSIMHYCNVLVALLRNHSGNVGEMADVLLKNRVFAEKLESKKYDGHPWQMILWLLALYSRGIGRKEKYESLYKEAISVAAAAPENTTMYSFALSMSAERILYLRSRNEKNISSAESEYKKLLNTLSKGISSENMVARFMYNTNTKESTSNDAMAAAACSYLR